MKEHYISHIKPIAYKVTFIY